MDLKAKVNELHEEIQSLYNRAREACIENGEEKPNIVKSQLRQVLSVFSEMSLALNGRRAEALKKGLEMENTANAKAQLLARNIPVHTNRVAVVAGSAPEEVEAVLAELKLSVDPQLADPEAVKLADLQV